jgi:predicted phage terminase large subunit-like protein
MTRAALSSWASVDTGPFQFQGASAPFLASVRKRHGFRSFVDRVTRGRFQWYRHAAVLAAVLQRVADGKLPRLIVMMPPRHGKSEEVSRLFPAYYLRRYPSRWVGLTSYGAELARTFSRSARANFVEGGGRMNPAVKAQTHWETDAGGGMWATGVGGAQSGKGFHLGIIDDPLKDRKEADSALIRENQKEWYRSTFYTRAEPLNAIVLVLTRWHMDDLCGWLLASEIGNEPENWHIVRFPAEAEAEKDADFEVPDTCTLEPDWRELGDPLCPERYPSAALAKNKADSREWASLFQQRPRPREGNLFKFSWFEGREVGASPEEARRVRYWDLAGSDGRGDFTAGVRMAKGADGVVYIEDVVRGQWSPHQRDQKIRAVAEADNARYPRTVTWIEKESGIGGEERMAALTRLLSGFTIRSERPTGDKAFRADPFASQCEAGNVRIVRGDWKNAFLDELCSFGPGCDHDDMVDAASGAFNKLANQPKLTQQRFRVA